MAHYAFLYTTDARTPDAIEPRAEDDGFGALATRGEFPMLWAALFDAGDIRLDTADAGDTARHYLVAAKSDALARFDARRAGLEARVGGKAAGIFDQYRAYLAEKRGANVLCDPGQVEELFAGDFAPAPHAWALELAYCIDQASGAQRSPYWTPVPVAHRGFLQKLFGVRNTGVPIGKSLGYGQYRSFGGEMEDTEYTVAGAPDEDWLA